MLPSTLAYAKQPPSTQSRCPQLTVLHRDDDRDHEPQHSGGRRRGREHPAGSVQGSATTAKLQQRFPPREQRLHYHTLRLPRLRADGVAFLCEPHHDINIPVDSRERSWPSKRWGHVATGGAGRRPWVNGGCSSPVSLLSLFHRIWSRDYQGRWKALRRACLEGTSPPYTG